MLNPSTHKMLIDFAHSATITLWPLLINNECCWMNDVGGADADAVLTHSLTRARARTLSRARSLQMLDSLTQRKSISCSQCLTLESRSSSHCLHVHESQRIQIPEKSVVFWGWRWAVLERGERRSGRTSPDEQRLIRGILPTQHVSVFTQLHKLWLKWRITREKGRISHFNNMKSQMNTIKYAVFL